MAIDDPKLRQRKVDDDHDDADGESLQTQLATLQAQVQMLLAAKGGGLSEDRLEAILTRVAQMSADAQERAANPSNKTHPAISVFSYPEGDRARPRPDLKCKMFWVGYPLTKDTTTAEEIELLNQATPGTFTFQRTDKSADTLTVTGSMDPSGQLSQLVFEFHTKERRETLPAMVDLLRSAFRIKTPEQIELETLRAQVAQLAQTAVPA